MISNTRTVDVLILGGGPAGCAAALWLAMHGLRAAIVERSLEPQNRPGETLHPGITSLFKDLGVLGAVEAAAQERPLGHWFRGPGEERFIPYSSDAGEDWRGYQILRSDLDRILLKRAEETGVTVVRGVAPASVLLKDNRVTAVQTPGILWSPRYTIDATGRRRWLQQQLRLPLGRLSPRLLAFYGYAHGHCPSLTSEPRFTWRQTYWNWTAPLGQGWYHWMNLAFPSSDDSVRTPPSELQTYCICKETRIVDVTWRSTPMPAGDGYFLVGDAAAVLDPGASHGVLRAIMSGICAARLILDTANNLTTEVKAQNIYNHWHDRFITRDIQHLRAYYSQLLS